MADRNIKRAAIYVRVSTTKRKSVRSMLVRSWSIFIEIRRATHLQHLIQGKPVSSDTCSIGFGALSYDFRGVMQATSTALARWHAES
jgi:hypothetical protein